MPELTSRLQCRTERHFMKLSGSNSAVVFELCVGGIDDVKLAAKFGVDRIELNSGMAVGGLTPPAALIACARRTFAGPILAMVRPREGGFAYSDAEFMQMIEDCESILTAGMDGIAIGCLESSGNVHVERCRKIRSLFPNITLVFHKAFDVTPDLMVAAQQLIDCGFNRILTSGGCITAFEGRNQIRLLLEKYGEQIEFVVGGGVRAHNVHEILNDTGCHQIHSAVRSIVVDESTCNNPTMNFGAIESGEISGYGAAEETQLREILRVLNRVV